MCIFLIQVQLCNNNSKYQPSLTGCNTTVSSPIQAPISLVPQQTLHLEAYQKLWTMIYTKQFSKHSLDSIYFNKLHRYFNNLSTEKSLTTKKCPLLSLLLNWTLSCVYQPLLVVRSYKYGDLWCYIDIWSLQKQRTPEPWKMGKQKFFRQKTWASNVKHISCVLITWHEV